MSKKQEDVWIVEYKCKGGRKWRVHYEAGMFISYKEAFKDANGWWGPDGHDCPFRVVRYVPGFIVNGRPVAQNR